MESNPFIIQQPFGLENAVNAGTSQLKMPQVPGAQSPAEQLKVDPNVIDATIKKSFENIMTAPAKPNPYESKFQSADDTKRYSGRSINYGDTDLDPNLLDARYSKTQSFLEQSYNNLKVGIANAGATFALGMLGQPDLIKSIKSGVTGEDNTHEGIVKDMYEWSRGVAETSINFQNEQDQKTDAWNTIKNVLLPSFISGSTTGWGNIFESAGYGIGAGAAIAAQEAAISYATAGIGTLPSLSILVARSLNNVNNLRKYATLADRIMDTSRIINRVGQSLGGVDRIKKAARWAYGSTIASHGEAAFEGLEGTQKFLKDQTEKYLKENGTLPVGEALANIQKMSEKVGTARYWANMGLLMATNSLQLKRLFRNVDIARQAEEELAQRGLKIGVEEGTPIAKKAFELKSDWWSTGFRSKAKPYIEKAVQGLGDDFVKETVSEGGEEFTQGWIDKAVNNYFTWKIDHRGQSSLDKAMESVGEGFSDSWTTEGLKAFLSGSIGGVAQQSLYSVPGYNTRKKTNKLVEDELNKTLGKYKNFNLTDFINAGDVNSVRNTVSGRAEHLNASGVADEIADGAAQNSDTKIYKDMEALSFFTLAEPYVNKGHGQILIEQFNYGLEKLSNEDLQQMTGDETITKDKAKSNFERKVKEVEASYNLARRAYRNPYNVRTQKEKHLFFEQNFVPELAFLDHRVTQLNKRRGDIQNSLGDYYDEFKYFADEKNINKGRAYIEQQLETLKASEPYLRSLAQADETLKGEFVKEKYLANLYEKSLNKLDTFINKEGAGKEDYEEFLDTYYDAFAVKLKVDNKGFYNKDQVFQQLSDHRRIIDDLTSVESQLKTYLTNKGEDIFKNTYISALKREDRKRHNWSLTQAFKGTAVEIKDKFSNLTDTDIEEILGDSSSNEEALANAEEFNKKKGERDTKVEEVKNKVRERFVKEGKGDKAEDWINENTVTSANEKEIQDQLDKYFAVFDDEEYNLTMGLALDQLLKDVQLIDPNFEGTGLLIEEANENIYNSLPVPDKIKYQQEIVKFNKTVKDHPGLPDSMIKDHDDLIKEAEDIIKELKDTKDVDLVIIEVVENYNITKKGDRYNISLNNKFLTFSDTYQEAKDFIEQKLIEEERLSDASFDHINNLENKYENGYFNPVYFDQAGNLITDKKEIIRQIELRTKLFNKISRGKSEKEIAEDITSNLVLKKYYAKGDNSESDVSSTGESMINQPNEFNPGLLKEKVLASKTVDTVVAYYSDSELGLVPINSYKNYETGLGFPTEVELKKVFKKGGDTNLILNFIKGLNYYQFLEKSILDPTVYEMLQGTFITFKGTPQEQFNLLVERQKLFEKMSTDSLENIKKDLIFTREFGGINYENMSNKNITDVMYPFALLNEEGENYNQYVFFFVSEPVNSKSVGDVKFIGLPDNYHKQATEKIQQSFNRRRKDGFEVSKGYYMLITDSSGNPATYSLRNKEITAEEFYLKFSTDLNPLTNVGIQDKSGRLKFNEYKDGKFEIIDTLDKSKVYVDFTAKTVADINNLKDILYVTLGKEKTWYDENKQPLKKVYPVETLSLKLIETASRTPTSVQQIVDTREITSIASENYLVHKVVPKWRETIEKIETPKVKKEKTVKPKVKIESKPETGFNSNSIASAIFPKGVPYFVNTQEVDIFVSRIENSIATPEQITTAIYTAYANQIARDTTGGAFYLNEGINLAKLDEFSSKVPIDKMGAFFASKGDPFQMFTTRVPYSSNTPNTSDIEERVKEILKHCNR